jgi:phage tail-like protein
MTMTSRFSITIDGHEIASFAELQGITTSVTPLEFMKSGAAYLQNPAGRKNVLTFKDGTSNTLQMWAWHEAARNGLMAAPRKSAKLVVYDRGTVVASYFLENAWPSEVDMRGLKAGSSEILMETVVLNYDGCHRLTR